jgi:segregation and condensation protein A
VTLNSLLSSTSKYQVATEIYSGPLDLLLQLIERAELDITRLSLAKVTDQFLEHLQSLVVRDPIEVSGFLVMAARLVLIKSLVLLPRPDAAITSAQEEDPGEVLARQLITYKRFKEIAHFLHEREIQGFRTYLRLAPQPKIPGKFIPGSLDGDQLLQAYLSVLNASRQIHPLSDAVGISAITLKQKIDEIVTILQATRHSTFNTLLTQKHTRLEVIVTFLALLELIKHHSILAVQENPFTEIHLESVGDLRADIETEF